MARPISLGRGLLIVISAPSGCGKTTVVDALLARDRRLVRSISWTTRPPRPGERHRKDYYFVSRRRFLGAKAQRQFLEWAQVYGQFYGTPKRLVEAYLGHGRDVILVIDTRGARQVGAKRRCVRIFIKPPSLAELKQRLFKRGASSKADLTRRLVEARDELKEARGYDYRVVNRTVERAAENIHKIILRERRRHVIYASRKSGK